MTEADSSTPAVRQSAQFLWKRAALALVIAGVSDALGFWVELFPPAQWALDAATALALFVILGRRWAILPALIAEAIPGVGVLPLWLLVVLSIAVYDDVRVIRGRSSSPNHS